MHNLYPFKNNLYSEDGTDLRLILPFIGFSNTVYKKAYSAFNAYLYDLDSNKYTLKEIIDVIVNEEGDCFRAENDELGIWATGDSVREALSNLKKEIIVLYEELKEIGESGLGLKPLTWWALLKNLIVKNENSRT